MDNYIQWLKDSNQPLFEQAGMYWRRYHEGLVPASIRPEPIHLSMQQECELLKESGALFLRYFSQTYEVPTAFWYIACSEYNFAKLSGKTRSQIRRAYKDCRVERVDPAWIADNAFACYMAAFSRYRSAQAETRKEFDDMSRGAAGGPFEFWAAFVGDQLAGFAKFAVDSDYAACLVLKVHPDFLSLSPSSALQDTILTTYVLNQRKTVVNGFRSISHDTNMHDFLLKFGYRRVYCDLKLRYQPLVGMGVKLLYPFRSTLKRATPSSALARKISGLLAQEGIRRAFKSDEEGKKPALIAPRLEPTDPAAKPSSATLTQCSELTRNQSDKAPSLQKSLVG